MAKKSKEKVKRLTKKEVVSRVLDFFDATGGEEVGVKKIFEAVGAKTHPAKMLTMDVLTDLVADDHLANNGQGVYRLAIRSQVMEGTFSRKRNGHNAFLPDDGGKSILVCERNSLHALDGDRVRITMLARRRGHTREAQVTEIIKRAHDQFVGTLQVERGFGFLITEGRALATDVFIPKEYLAGGKTGDKAVVKLIEWPENSKSPIGKVVDILGKKGDNTTEMHAILAEYGLPYSYPKSVERAAEKLSADITDEEIARREDFRDVLTFTIDPRDAKDFDDALSLRRIEGGWEVGVHIADVSHYVKEGDIIDREAQRRATSVYLVDRTIPMLPERLCNFICSLRPNEDKLAYSAIFHLTPQGEVMKWHLAHTVIRSDRRFTYEEVQDIFEQNGEASPEDLAQPGHHPERIAAPDGKPVGEYAEELITLNRLAKQIRSRRFADGAIGFDRAEVRFEIDEKGRPVSTYVKVAKDANKLIEEFMLLANRYVAESVGRVPKGKKAKVLPYRIHDVPDPEKLERLQGFVAKFGYKVRTEGSKTEVSKSLNKLLTDVKGKKEENMVEMVALRAMMKAKYSVHNIGHYGLMFPYYTHFTSPIRRYPDTMVHRLLTHYAEGGRSGSINKYEELCEHSSQMEQLATAAERASIKYKQVEFMSERIGQEFSGIISGVTEFGLYVEETESKCEGMVPLRTLLGDYYEFDERNYCLVGRRTRKVYALGDKVTIRVERANLEKKQLDYALVEEDGHSDAPRMPIMPTKKGKNKKGRR
ncbi:MAG: ribonuclease R [Bacteroidaceae bacterium]|nr:ribonuclease R [Bacteroidaceae bacterium]